MKKIPTMQDISPYDYTKRNKLSNNTAYSVQLCENCWCMTHTVDGECAKCGAKKCKK